MISILVGKKDGGVRVKRPFAFVRYNDFYIALSLTRPIPYSCTITLEDHKFEAIKRYVNTSVPEKYGDVQL